MINFIKRWPIEYFVAIVVLLGYFGGTQEVHQREIVLLALLVMFGVVGAVRLVTSGPAQDDYRCDIWKPQARIMAKSGQHLSKYPTITRDSFLYFALILEEVGELAQALRGCIDTRGIVHHHDLYADDTRAILIRTGVQLTSISRELRDQVARMPDGAHANWVVNRRALIQVTDGITDLSVVTAGFSVASGLPAREAYREVVNSNLSKANPQTGLIERDPSGKWIKGSDYWAPNLGAILDAAYQRGAMW